MGYFRTPHLNTFYAVSPYPLLPILYPLCPIPSSPKTSCVNIYEKITQKLFTLNVECFIIYWLITSIRPE
jgi:hypothetical protein